MNVDAMFPHVAVGGGEVLCARCKSSCVSLDDRRAAERAREK